MRSGLTQEELAARAGLSARAISALETGQRRRPYPHTVRVLATVLGLSDGERAALDAGITPRGRRASLPAVPSSLVGRDDVVRSVEQLVLGGTTRLLTLTGPGGVGKTRLALELVQRLADRFADGVAFVGLASVPDPDLVVPTIARCLDVQDPGAETIHGVVHGYLRARRVLLVLDNLEHLPDAAPELAALLEAAPRLQVLATSRSPLRLRGEQVFPVAPLELDAAVQLFQARAAEAAVDVGGADPGVVGDLCRRLDGLPLAIELAAARTRVLPPEALLARLDRPLSVLSGGARDLPERQQAIAHTVSWSHDLLNPPEQDLFRRLAAFPGGWALDDASAIAELDTLTALELHTGLVDASLIVSDAQTAQPRFDMLETIRAYAEERLTASGEAHAIHARHAAHYHALLLLGAKEIWSPAQPDWLERLNLDRANVRDALRWTLAQGDLEATAHACFALCMVGWAGIPFDEEEVLAGAALTHETSLSPVAQAKLLFTKTCPQVLKGNFDGAAEMLATATRLANEAGDRATLAWMLLFRGALAGIDGRRPESAATLDEAAALGRQLSIPDVIVRAASMRSLFDLADGRLMDADRRLVGCLAEVGDSAAPWSLGAIPVMRARIAFAAGDLDRAEHLHRPAAATMGRLKDRNRLGVPQLFLAGVATRRSAGEAAACLLGAANILVERGLFLLRPYDLHLDEQFRLAATEQLGPDASAAH
jgi:predicted ATPase/DNA-binding XRE family transcriptional regulator